MGRNRIEAHPANALSIGLMAAAAQEQQAFDALEQKDPAYLQDLSPKDLSDFIERFLRRRTYGNHQRPADER